LTLPVFCRFGVGVGAGVGVFFIFRTTSRIPPNLIIIESLGDENHMQEYENQSSESENESSEDENPPNDPNLDPSTPARFNWVENGVFVPPVVSFVEPTSKLCPGPK